MHSVVHVNLHCRVASSHLHRPRANVERDVHFKKELDFLIYMRRLAAGVKPCLTGSRCVAGTQGHQYTRVDRAFWRSVPLLQWPWPGWKDAHFPGVLATTR